MRLCFAVFAPCEESTSYRLFLDTSTQLITSRSVVRPPAPLSRRITSSSAHRPARARTLSNGKLASVSYTTLSKRCTSLASVCYPVRSLSSPLLSAYRSRRTGPLWNLTQPKGAQLVSDTNKALDNFLYPLVDEVLADVSSGTEIEAPLHGFSEFYDRAKLRDNLLTMIVGSHDTLTGSVTSLFYELARHPEIMKEARKAVSNQLEDAMEPALEDIKALPILRAIFDETLRLYPAGAVNGRGAL